MQSPADAVRAYLVAKDGNRPHLARLAFADDAVLKVRVNADGIDFPALTTGRDAIADLLVRQFATRFENVYSFCLAAPPAVSALAYESRWLVAMSEKSGSAVRVGCGTYRWVFREQSPRLAAALDISIEHMPVLAPAALRPVMEWAAGLPYPWCPAASALAGIPGFPELAPVRAYVEAGS